MQHSIEKEFSFTFTSKDEKSTLTVPVTIPVNVSTEEFMGRLILSHNLPCYIEDDLKNSLSKFIEEETKKWHENNAQAAIDSVINGSVNEDDLIERWTRAFTQEVKEYAKPEEITNEQMFSDIYHTLIHSPALETVLNLEHTYALSVEDIITNRDADLQHLDSKQHEEMEEALANVGTKYTDEDINQLAQRHFDNTQLISSKWASELSNLRETQKREFKEWIKKVHEDSQTNSNTPSYVQRLRAMSSGLPDAEEEERQLQPSRLEESFTIHLGAQMKTTHNIRLLCTDVLDLCRHKTHTVGGVVIPQPQRLQTAMSLYSNSLCGLIMLVDNRLNSYTGMKRAFSRVCEQSTDFHFSDLDRRLYLIEEEFIKANEIRSHRVCNEDGDVVSIKSTGSGISATSSSSDTQTKNSNYKLNNGDFYITEHSNLSEVHVVFHLVCDDSVRSGDISSRHPAILSLRNIIKLCFRYDIHTITIPLLLTHEMTEEMTIPWCMKRAELVYKCVKGFMIEMATYGAQESRTIQFLVPRGLSEDMFMNISNMLPTIFRLSNPVIHKSGPNSTNSL
ncbi:hypothetical protein SNE40_018593 [Patella caerulea]|uniref:Uncharacterized protein n=1 Tax=Patella caerulea TaxID=87958 RepID=A0AAN8J6L3_PATCE